MRDSSSGDFPDDAVHAAGRPTLRWSGHLWNVKEGSGLGPGPNHWSADNAWVDGNGFLHLKISRAGGRWRAAEIGTARSLGFGTYQFWMEGRVDLLDPNVVLGLFGYAGPDGTNEIDVELGRWGDAAGPNASYTVYPSVHGLPHVSEAFGLELEGTFTTQRFRWEPGRVVFQTLGGHRDDDASQIHGWSFAPAVDAARKIPQRAMPARLNLWLMNGAPPMNGREVEIVIRRFAYTPL